MIYEKLKNKINFSKSFEKSIKWNKKIDLLENDNELYIINENYTSIESLTNEKLNKKQIKRSLELLNSKFYNESINVDIIKDKNHGSNIIFPDTPCYGCFSNIEFNINDVIGICYGVLYSEEEWNLLNEKEDDKYYPYTEMIEIDGYKMNLVHLEKRNEIGYIQGSINKDDKKEFNNYGKKVEEKESNAKFVNCKCNNEIPIIICISKKPIKRNEEIRVKLDGYWKERIRVYEKMKYTEKEKIKYDMNEEKMKKRNENIKIEYKNEMYNIIYISELYKRDIERNIENQKTKLRKDIYEEMGKNHKKVRYNNDERVRCAFNKEHVLKRDRLIWHHNKCPNRDMTNMIVCIQNGEHIVKIVDFAKHLSECPNILDYYERNKKLPNMICEELKDVKKNLLKNKIYDIERIEKEFNEKEIIKRIDNTPKKINEIIEKEANKKLEEKKSEIKIPKIKKKLIFNDDGKGLLYLNYITEYLKLLSDNICEIIIEMLNRNEKEIPFEVDGYSFIFINEYCNEINSLFKLLQYVLNENKFFKEEYEIECNEEIRKILSLKKLYTNKKIIIPNISEVFDVISKVFNAFDVGFNA